MPGHPPLVIVLAARGLSGGRARAIQKPIPKFGGEYSGWEVKNQLFWARVTTVALTVFSGVFALYIGELVALLGAFGWGTFAAAIVPTVAVGFNWKRATPTAANIAIISSLVINFGSRLLGLRLPYNIDMGALALLVSIVLFTSISLLSPPPRLRADVQEAMSL